MPVYVYKNLNTGETFEVEQRITESALTVDPETGDPVKRLIQPVGIAFRGSGFYVTDSRGSSKGASGEGSSKGASSEGSSSEGSSSQGSSSKDAGKASSGSSAGAAGGAAD